MAAYLVVLNSISPDNTAFPTDLERQLNQAGKAAGFTTVLVVILLTNNIFSFQLSFSMSISMVLYFIG